MYFQFVLSFGLFAVLLELPGFLFFQLLNVNRISSLLYAPAFSIALYNVLGIVFGFIGIRSSLWSVFIIPTVLLLVAILAKAKMAKPQRHSASKRNQHNWKIILLYLACGLAACLVLFIAPLDGFNSFVTSYDNLYHYNAIRSLLESGYWSPFDTSCYLALPESMNPMPGGTYPLDGFYPIGWHLLIALLMSIAGCGEAMAINVANCAFVGVVFPLGMYLLMATLFPKRSTMIAGALCSFVCAIFPWHLLIEWPLFPNLAAFCLIPLLEACFILFMKHAYSKAKKGSKAPKGYFAHPLTAFLLTCVACGTIHPNSIFTAVALLTPFVVIILGCIVYRKWGIIAGIATSVVVLCAIVFGWIGLANSDAFKRVIDVVILSRQTPEQAIQGITQFSFTNIAGQPILFYLAIIGAIASLVQRRNCWLVISLILAMHIYYVSACAEEGPLKQILTGFWYTESKRTGSIVGLASLPLFACGLASVGNAVAFAMKKMGAGKKGGLVSSCITIILGVALVGTLYLQPADGNEENPPKASALQLLSTQAEKNYEKCALDYSETTFIEEVIDTIGPDKAVINLPYDGSIIGYGICGLKSYYLERYGYGTAQETPESITIRTGLRNIASDENVRKAVETVGCSYLLLLETHETMIWDFDESDWEGINLIDDNTPGFSVVLSEYGMRLYHIDCMPL